MDLIKKAVIADCLIIIACIQFGVSQNPILRENEYFCGNKPADIAFLLDSSNSIWEPNFRIQINFVKNVVSMFDIGLNATRVAIATFSTYVEPKIWLNNYTDIESLMEAIDDITRDEGYDTYTDGAIRYMRENIFIDERNDTSAKIGIVLTDGQSAEVLLTIWEAAKIKREGVTMFAIGIGYGTNPVELKGMASKPASEHVFQINNYEALESIKNTLAVKTCKVIPKTTTTTTTTTTTPAPTTTSTTTEPTTTTTEPTTTTTEPTTTTTESTTTTTTTTTESATTTIEATTTTTEPSTTTTEPTTTTIEATTTTTEPSTTTTEPTTTTSEPTTTTTEPTTTTIEATTTTTEPTTTTTEPTTTTTEITTTTTEPTTTTTEPTTTTTEATTTTTEPTTTTTEPTTTTTEPTTTTTEATTTTTEPTTTTTEPTSTTTELTTTTTEPTTTTTEPTTTTTEPTTTTETTTITLTTEPTTATTEPSEITTTMDSEIHMFSKYYNQSLITYSTTESTPITTTIPRPTIPALLQAALQACHGGQADIVFGIDASKYVRIHELQSQIEFAKKVMRSISHVQRDTRFGAVIYGKQVKMLSDLQRANVVYSKINANKTVGGKARLDEAIKFVRTKVFKRSQFRGNTSQITILLMGSPATKITRSKKEATRARNSGIEIIVIGVGDIDVEEVRAVSGTSDGSNQFQLPAFYFLDNILTRVIESMCQARQNQRMLACGNRQEADILFFLDSGAVGYTNTRKVLDFISAIAKEVDIGPKKVQMGVVTSGCNRQFSGFNLNQYKGRVGVARGLTFGNSWISQDKLSFVRKEKFNQKYGGRRSAKQMAVVMMDESVKEAALNDQPRMRDVDIIMVWVGRSLNRGGMNTNGTTYPLIPGRNRSGQKDSQLWTVPSFDDLPSMKNHLLAQLCDEI